MNEIYETGSFSEDLAYENVVFAVAKRPNDRLEVTFERFEVDGAPVHVNPPRELPGDQGFGVEVGTFPPGTEIEVRWQIHTGIEVPEGDVVIGHCPNWKLTKLVRLERHKVEPFTTYAGMFKVIP